MHRMADPEALQFLLEDRYVNQIGVLLGAVLVPENDQVID